MKILDVIPINKGVWRDTLSYFTSQNINPGSIVSIPLKNQETDGLVISEEKVENLKSQIKTSDFGWRKINQIKKKDYFLPEFINAAKITADYFAVYPGQIIKVLIPQAILDNLSTLKNTTQLTSNNKPAKAPAEIFVLQQPDEERLLYYKSLIRESFAKKQSVFLCLPTVAEIERLSSLIDKGIGPYVIVLHSQLAKKQLVNLWEKALTIDHPILVIATPLFLSLPRADIATIIIDRENSSAYKNLSRPHADWRFFAEQLAQQKNIRLILGDIALRSEIIYRLGRGDLNSVATIKYRLSTENRQQIIPLLKDPKKTNQPSTALAEALLEQIENARDQNQRFFIFTGQRGLTPLTVCKDCGLVASCDVCHSTLAIHKNNSSNERIFICHKCGQVVEIGDVCPRCRGSRFELLGSGSEKIEQEILEHWPDVSLFRLDSDTAKTAVKAREILQKFLNTPGSILIGTNLALNYLREKVENIAAVNLDAVFTLPDYRAGEKIFSHLLRLRLLASRRFFIQTRNPEEKVFSYVLAGSLLDFYRDEIEERRQLGYPPFKILIKISREGLARDIKKDIAQAEKILSAYEPIVYPSLARNAKGQPVLNILIRRPAAKWPDHDLINLIKSLSPIFIVNVDPESIL